MKIAYEILVNGLVQGVGFRHYTKQEADKLSVFGDVTNQDDGSVLIHVGGENEKVLKFLEWCHNGPPSSNVESLQYQKIENINSKLFQIKR